MIISEITNLMTSGCLRIEAYRSDGNVSVMDTRVNGWADIPFDVAQKEVIGISVIDDTLVLEYYDDGKGE